MGFGSKLSKSNIKDTHMDKFTRKTSFEQWFSPISTELFKEMVENLRLDYYTKKLYMAPFMKLLLFAVNTGLKFPKIVGIKFLTSSLFRRR